jgi:hypothetical protein
LIEAGDALAGRWRFARRCSCSLVRHVLRDGKGGDAAKQQDPTPAGSLGVRGVAVLAVRIVARLLIDIVGIDIVGLDRLSGWAHRGRRIADRLGGSRGLEQPHLEADGAVDDRVDGLGVAGLLKGATTAR